MKKVVALILVALVVGAGVWLARAPYQKWKQDCFLAQARQYAAKSDFRNAALSARQALDLNPGNVDACRIMAEVTERFKAPQALTWRMRVVELRPGSVPDRLELARTALLLGKYPRAVEALRGVDEAGRNGVEYHTMAAMVAISQDDVASAVAHYDAAAKLDPQDKTLQFDLAVLSLQSKDQKVVDAAIGSLERLYTDPACRRDALRHLVMATLRNKDLARADGFSRELAAGKPPLFDDHLLRLSVLKEAQSAELGAYLAALEAEAARDAQQINALGSWLDNHGMADEAVKWLTSLPPATRNEQPVAVALADAHGARGDWARVQALLEDRQWGDFDFMRLALLARARRAQQQDIAATADWHAAVNAASGRLRPLSSLVRMAEAWGWDREKEEMAWLVVQRYPGERWALELLHHYYTATSNTHGLQKVYAALMAADASDLVARNNYASLSLLLKLQVNEAAQIARENCSRQPGNAILISTYAYALHLQGHTPEGIKLLEKLPDDKLQQPGVATYYGVMLAAAGHPDKAAKYLEIAEHSPLLPEEKALVATARNQPLSLK